MRTIETDYLVVGAGAMGMAFADTIVSESKATVTIVDRYDQPGGHWTVAYPFVRLHQPSTCYGVNSRPLGNDVIDQLGWNAGLYELAGGHEILAYLDEVMQETLLPSGRVTYLPMTEYVGEGICRSLVTGEEVQVVAGKTVDTTYLDVQVPSMRQPPYAVPPGVTCVPPNGLAKLAEPPDRFTIVGAGKTGVDACLWLLRQGVDPARITWIMPRDAWYENRELLQPGPLFAERITEVQYETVTAITGATSIADLLDRLDACGFLLRLDPTVRPTMFRCATVTPAELEQLRRIADVVRLGHVRRIEPDRIILDGGDIPTSPSTLHVDCTADGLARRPALPIFDGTRITLQAVRGCQQVFSAALIAHVELAYADQDTKNQLCVPIPHPNADIDAPRILLADTRADLRWGADEALSAWLANSRLHLYGRIGVPLPEEPEALAAALEELQQAGEMVTAKLEALLAGAAEPAMAAS